MNKILLSIAISMYIVLVVMFYSSGIVERPVQERLADSIFLIAPLFPVAIGIYATRRFGVRSVHGKSLLFLLLGISLWFMGELTWLIFSLMGMDPFPSVADVFYLAAYPFVIHGIMTQLKMGSISWSSKKILLSAAVIASLSAITLFFGIISAYNADASILENVISMAYGIGDLVIIIGIVFLLNLSSEFRGGILSRAWLIFGLGMISYWIGDVLNAMFIKQYVSMEWLYRSTIDYFWIAGYLLMAIGLFYSTDLFKKRAQTNQPKRGMKYTAGNPIRINHS